MKTRCLIRRPVNIHFHIGIEEILLSLLLFVILTAMLLTTDRRYLDFGDGVYLYISSKLLEGSVLYKDILTPQPPILFAIGAAILRIGYSWKTVRLFSIFLGLAISLLIYIISVELFNNRRVALAASATYHMLPMCWQWGRSFQADSLVTFFSLLSFMFFKSFKNKRMIIASIFSFFAIYSKYSFLPAIFFNVIYLSLRRRNLLKYYLTPLIMFGGSLLVYLNIYSAGGYLENTIIHQLRAPGYPFNVSVDLTLDGLSQIFSEGGAFTFLSLMGILHLHTEMKNGAGYFLGYMLSLFAPFLLILRRGTGMYIFHPAEPFIAIFSAYFIFELVAHYRKRVASITVRRNFQLSRLSFSTLMIVLSILSLYISPITNLSFNQYINYQRYYGWSNVKYVDIVTEIIENYTSRNDKILSPPYFAFLTQRGLISDYYCDSWIWLILYRNGDRDAVRAVEEVSSILEDRSIKLVIIDWRIAQIAPIYEVVRRNYIMVRSVVAYDMLEIYIPKSSSTKE